MISFEKVCKNLFGNSLNLTPQRLSNALERGSQNRFFVAGVSLKMNIQTASKKDYAIKYGHDNPKTISWRGLVY